MTLVFLLSCSDSAELPEVDARRLAVESGMIDADDPTAQIADVVIAELDGVPPEEVVIRTLHVVERIERDVHLRRGEENRYHEQIQAFAYRDGWISIGERIEQKDWVKASNDHTSERSLRAVDVEGDGIHELLLTHDVGPAYLVERYRQAPYFFPGTPSVWLLSWSESGWRQRIDVLLEGSVGVFDTDSDGTIEIAVLYGRELRLFGYNAPGPLLPRSHRPEDWLADFLLMRLERPTALPDDVHLVEWLRYAIRLSVHPSDTRTPQAGLQERYLSLKTAEERVWVAVAMEWLAEPSASAWIQAQLTRPEAPVEALLNALGAIDPDAVEAVLMAALGEDPERLTLATAALVVRPDEERRARLIAMMFAGERTDADRLAMLVGMSAEPTLVTMLFTPDGTLDIDDHDAVIGPLIELGWFERMDYWRENLSVSFLSSLLDDPKRADWAAIKLDRRREGSEALGALLRRSEQALRTGQGWVSHAVIGAYGSPELIRLGIAAAEGDEMYDYIQLDERVDLTEAEQQELRLLLTRFLEPQHPLQARTFVLHHFQKHPSPEALAIIARYTDDPDPEFQAHLREYFPDLR